MPIAIRVPFVFVLAFVASVAHPATPEPLPNNPALVTGELENGVRFFVMPHAQPPGRVSLRLHLPVGSLNEADDQRGYAHLVEHLAFIGSGSFPAGRAVEHFEALGMTLGRHQNGFTAIDQTIYSLDLPGAGDAIVRDGLTFLADVLGRLEFTEARIEQERAVVIAELHTYLGPQQRLMDQWFKRVARGARALERPILGTDDSIEAAEIASAEDFYRRWYSTHSAAVLLVGDIDVERARALIAETFGELPATPLTKPKHPGTIEHERAFAQVITDPDVAGAQITLLHVGPMRAPSTTVDDFRRGLVDLVAVTALNRRFEDRSAGGEASFRSGGAWTGPFFSAGWSIGASVFGDPARWRALVTELAAELKSFQTGIGPRELEATKQALRVAVRQYAELDHTLPVADVAQSLLAAVHAREPWLSGAQSHELVERYIGSITADEVAEVFRQFDPARMSVTLTMASSQAAPSEDELLEASVEAFAATVEARAERDEAASMPSFTAAPGEVVESAVEASTGVYSAWLSNGVRVHHRYMDRRPNSVAVFATLAGGTIEETAETRAHTLAATGVLYRLATRKLSSGDLRTLLFARSLSIETFLAEDAVAFGMDATRDEFETGLQLLHALLTEPYLEPVAFAQWKQGMADVLREQAHNPSVALARALVGARYPVDDPRWRPLTIADIEGLDRDAVQGWFDAFVRRAPLEIAIVGDIPREDAIALAARYVGSLPARAHIDPQLFDRDVEQPEYPIVDVVEVPSATPQAAVLVGFTGADEVAVDDRRALWLAARILTIRMNRRLREEAGLVYSIAAIHEHAALAGLSTFSASALVAPDNAKRLESMIGEMYEEFAADGPDESEVAVALRQFETEFAEDTLEPFFWANRYARASYDPVWPTPPAALVDAYRALTPDQIREVFARYHGASNGLRYIALPAGE